jgi:hypothetical protein
MSRLSAKVAFLRQQEKIEVIGLSDLLTLFIDVGVHIANRCKEHSMFSKAH